MKLKSFLICSLLLAGCASEPNHVKQTEYSPQIIVVDYQPPDSYPVTIEYRIWEVDHYRPIYIRGYRDRFGRLYRRR